MKLNLLRIIIGVTVSLTLLTMASTVHADEPVIVQPLFEYPVPPDDIVSLEDRSDYIMDHFWDALDVKNKETVDQNALNHAFEVYSTTMRWADANKVHNSVNALLKRIDKNPVLLLQMTRAAEENLYGPRASMWIDEIYLPFAKAVVKHKKIDKSRKLRYERQIKTLETSAVGKIAPEFKFTKPDGREGLYFPMSTPTVLFFGDPDCFECRMAKLKLETDIDFSDLVKEGKINVVYIIADPEEGWTEKIKDVSSGWAVGGAVDLDEIFDLRLTPSIFLVDSTGHIKYKNITAERAVILAKEMLSR